MAEFIAVDWGTSSFRASIVDSQGCRKKTISTSGGIGQIKSEQQRQYLIAQCTKLRADLSNIDIVMSGMVGSTIGLQEVAYVESGKPLTQLSQQLVRLRCDQLKAWIVPGLCCKSHFDEVDVMRGEETQLLGWINRVKPKPTDEYWVCTPGTHSKWVQLKGDKVVRFSSSVSGELYHLLSDHSVLVQGQQEYCQQSFVAGVQRVASGEPLSHLLFSTRARVLAKQLLAEHSAAYLSGLVVGAEIAAQLNLLKQHPIVLIGQPELTQLYQLALQIRGLTSRCFCGGDEAVNGMLYCYQHGIEG